MTRLSSVLYQYVLEHSEAFLALMPEYPDCRRFSDEKEAALRAALSPEACILLDDLLRERALQHGAEREAVFQASLSLCRELYRSALPYARADRYSPRHRLREA